MMRAFVAISGVRPDASANGVHPSIPSLGSRILSSFYETGYGVGNGLEVCFNNNIMLVFELVDGAGILKG